MESNFKRDGIGFCIVGAAAQRHTRSQIVLLRQPLSSALGGAIQSVRSDLAAWLKLQPVAKFRFRRGGLVLNRDHADPRAGTRRDVHHNVHQERVGMRRRYVLELGLILPVIFERLPQPVQGVLHVRFAEYFTQVQTQCGNRP